eukprot:1157492-Pelagomonas_calceolata.AAC.8
MVRGRRRPHWWGLRGRNATHVPQHWRSTPAHVGRQGWGADAARAACGGSSCGCGSGGGQRVVCPGAIGGRGAVRSAD